MAFLCHEMHFFFNFVFGALDFFFEKWLNTIFMH